MKVLRKKFEKWVKETLDSLPEKYLNHLNNVAILVEDYPTSNQLKKVKLENPRALFGLYEGYHQSLRTNIGTVVPDKITIFRYAIMESSQTEKEVREKVENTVKHEIAHHFGSDEAGARKAARRKMLSEKNKKT